MRTHAWHTSTCLGHPAGGPISALAAIDLRQNGLLRILHASCTLEDGNDASACPGLPEMPYYCPVCINVMLHSYVTIMICFVAPRFCVCAIAVSFINDMFST